MLAAVLVFAGWLYYESLPSDFGPWSIEIQVSPDKQYFLQGENATFTFVVVNSQSSPVARPSHEITTVTKNGITVDDMDIHINLPASKTPTFPADSNTQLQWTWLESKDNQIIPHETGNYTLTVRLEGFGYETTGNCTFEIK